IVAVSDSRGAVHCPTGLDVERLLAAKRVGSVTGFASCGAAREIPAEDLVAVDCDLLVPAALEGLIHGGNAAGVKARVVLELANGPITPEADAILAGNNVIVFPDILANAGGVTVSYFEWVQNRQGYRWSIEKVQNRLRAIMEAEG